MKKIIILFSLSMMLFISLVASAVAPGGALPGGETPCSTRDDCIVAGWSEPADYCDLVNGDVVRPHLSCFMGKCDVLEGTADKESPYRIDCNYGMCYTDEDGTPRCCPVDGCPDIGGVGIPDFKLECKTRDDCIDAGMTETDDYCDPTNGDLVKPHLGCNIDGYCEIYEGEPNVDGPYRIDCNYDACYIKDDGTPKCCPVDGCPGLVMPGEPGPGTGGGPSVPGVIIPGVPDGKTECKTRQDCIDEGWEEPKDYCDKALGDVVRPHLSCFKGHCEVLEGKPDEDGPYRLDCNYGACYVKDDGTPMCCTKDGCPASEDDDDDAGEDDGDGGDDDGDGGDDDRDGGGIGDWIGDFFRRLFTFFFRK